jgi:iron complex transport system ATP-binding protein
VNEIVEARLDQGLSLAGVEAGYGRKIIVRDVTLPPLAAGTVTALLGPNGAGKSTLLRALAGFGTLGGEVMLDGLQLAGMPAVQRAATFGYLPQTLPPAVALTVLETVIGALRASPPSHHLASSAATITVSAYRALEEVGIGDLANRPLSELSGGQRQLAGLAQIVARRPRVLLLDEPTSALDLRYQTRVMRQVATLVKTHGLIAVVVMHDISLAARHSDRVAILSQGTLHSFGPPDEVITAPMLSDVYGVEARVEKCSQGHIQVVVDDEI